MTDATEAPPTETPAARVARLRAELAEAEREDRRARLDAFGRELVEMLERHGAELVPEVEIVGQQVVRAAVRARLKTP